MSQENTPDLFLSTLWNILSEQATTIKTQVPRLSMMWENYWQNLEVTLPEIRFLSLDKDRFFSEIPYRIECVQNLQYAMTDTYTVIKTLLYVIYTRYLSGNYSITEDFSEEDSIPASFRIAEILVGSLLQLITAEKPPIPLGFLIIAKNHSMLKLKGRTLAQIQEDFTVNNFPFQAEEIGSVLQQMIEMGYLKESMDEQTEEIRYWLVEEFNLTPDGEKLFMKKVRPLLDWAIEMWRSLFNIRSLDIVVPEVYPMQEFLIETLKRASTQGFANAVNVIENIANYYQHCLDQGLEVP